MNIKESFGNYTVEGVQGRFKKVDRGGFFKITHYGGVSGAPQLVGSVSSGDWGNRVPNRTANQQVLDKIKRYCEAL